MRGYELTERAVQDLRTAREWYDRQSFDLGNRFIDTVLAAVHVARERPTSFPEIEDGARRVLCDRFPFYVYFEIISDDRIRVLAVYHASRDPEQWSDAGRP
jgi:plasmid stabilization system protein ParE